MKHFVAVQMRGVLSGVACLAFLAAGATLIPACGGPNEYAVAGSGPAAGADAQLEVGRMEGSTNKLVKVNVKHLPPPDRVGEGLTAYVLWFVAEDREPTNAGRLGFDAETREANQQATCAYDKFVVMITAEETDQVNKPSDHVILKQEVE